MPIIKVWCLPNLDEDGLRYLYNKIVFAVEGVSELGLKEQNAITVLFPKDSMAYGLGEEIIVEVTGLFNKPERTLEVRQKLAEELGHAVSEMLPHAKIECLVYPFDPTNGFWSSK